MGRVGGGGGSVGGVLEGGRGGRWVGKRGRRECFIRKENAAILFLTGKRSDDTSMVLSTETETE